MADCNGTLYVSTDIAVEYRSNTELIATAERAHMPGEVLRIELVNEDARNCVRVMGSGPILVDGKLRHRLRLTPDSPFADRRQCDATELGALTRSLRVRMLNCSANGCLLESCVPLEVGTVATLEISVSGQVFSDVVQIVRGHAIAGSAGIYHIGARLLSTTPLHRGSLRHAMRSETSPAAAPLVPESVLERSRT